MFSYRAYGLNFLSALSFPELQTSEGKTDVRIEIVSAKTAATYKPSPILCVDASPHRVHLTWGGVGDLIIANGNQIKIIPYANAEQDALRLFLLGAGLGVLMHQRGLLVFHAGGVVIGERVVGFIGAKELGKSTTTAFLHHRGHPLVSDELLVLEYNSLSQSWLAIPGPPQIRLWDDALVSAGIDTKSVTRVRPGVDKFNLNATNIANDAYPLKCLHLLDAGEKLFIQPMLLSEAFIGVIPHLYVYRFGNTFFQAINLAKVFHQLQHLLQQITVKRLIRRYDLSQLSEIAELVEKDFEEELE